jgi:hypothetical protein
MEKLPPEEGMPGLTNTHNVEMVTEQNDLQNLSLTTRDNADTFII